MTWNPLTGQNEPDAPFQGFTDPFAIPTPVAPLSSVFSTPAPPTPTYGGYGEYNPKALGVSLGSVAQQQAAAEKARLIESLNKPALPLPAYGGSTGGYAASTIPTPTSMGSTPTVEPLPTPTSAFDIDAIKRQNEETKKAAGMAALAEQASNAEPSMSGVTSGNTVGWRKYESPDTGLNSGIKYQDLSSSREQRLASLMGKAPGGQFDPTGGYSNQRDQSFTDGMRRVGADSDPSSGRDGWSFLAGGDSGTAAHAEGIARLRNEDIQAKQQQEILDAPSKAMELLAGREQALAIAEMRAKADQSKVLGPLVKQDEAFAPWQKAVASYIQLQQLLPTLPPGPSPERVRVETNLKILESTIPQLEKLAKAQSAGFAGKASSREGSDILALLAGQEQQQQ